MSTVQIWILFPGLAAVVLLLLQRWELVVVVLGTLAALVLAWLAWWLPDQDLFFIGPLTIRLADTWIFLGRRFVLGGSERPVLVMLYLAAALWFGGTFVARPGRIFVPLGLGITALLTAAIAVDPFLYAALLIQMAVLVSVPLLVMTGGIAGRGLLRYLTFQTLGMPFILFAGWMLTGVEGSPAGMELVTRVSILIGLGFAFLLGIFPFHTWIPMLAEESHPYAAAFVLVMLPSAILFFGLRFLDRYAWLRAEESVYVLLRSGGVLMVVTAGLWAAFERKLGRMLGFAVILEIGLSLIMIGLAGGRLGESLGGQGGSVRVFFAALLPRGLSLGVWALSLVVIKAQINGLHYRDVQGVARRMPVASSALVLSHFSIAGLPLLASLPIRLALLEGLAQVSPLTALWVLAGSAGLLMGGLRTLAVLVMGKQEGDWQVTETAGQQFYLAVGSLVLLLAGIFPQWFLPLFVNIPQAFRQLVP
jgi:NADH-quinone oxidoreductase subunit N